MSNPTDEGSKTELGEEKDKEAKSEESDEEKAAAVDIGALDTYTTLRLFIGVLAGAAWRNLGLVVNPKTNKIEKDLDQARIAIDVFEFIFKKIEGKLGEDEKRQLSGLLNDLKINFVTHQ